MTVQQLNVRLMAEKTQGSVKCTDGVREIFGVLELRQSAVALHKTHVALPSVKVHSAHHHWASILRSEQGVSVSSALFEIKSGDADGENQTDREVCSTGRRHDNQFVPVLNTVDLDRDLDALLWHGATWLPVLWRIHADQCLRRGKKGCNAGDELISRRHGGYRQHLTFECS